MKGSGVSGERVRVSRTTHLEDKGLRKGSGWQWSQAGWGAFFFHMLGFSSRVHQASTPWPGEPEAAAI